MRLSHTQRSRAKEKTLKMTDQSNVAEASLAGRLRVAESSRGIAIPVLLLALILGGGLRFDRLGAEEMNRSEAAAWTAASAPTLKSAIALGLHLDPGALGPYDALLHGWIAVFGDGVATMRTPSAALGVLAIALVFAAVREILRMAGDGAERAMTAELAGAFAALLFACNLQMIAWGRISRMYPLMLAAVLAQIFFFARTCRRAGAFNWMAAGFFGALAAASNYTALFVFASEGSWLAYLQRFGRGRNTSDQISVQRPVGALMLGVVLLAPLAVTAGTVGFGALHAGKYEWIEQRPPWWPFRAIQVVSGNAALWPLVALSIFGGWRQWSQADNAVRFILSWLVLPFAMVMAVSYLLTPFMVERYVLSSLVAFLALAGLGIASFRSDIVRYAVAVLVVAQSLAHVHHHWRVPEDIQWREAAELAASVVPSGEKIAVMPPGEPLMVLRYYLSRSKHDIDVVGADAKLDGPEPAAIVQLELPREFLSAIQPCYPRTLQKFRHVEVLAR